MKSKGQHLGDGHDDVEQSDHGGNDEPVGRHGVSKVAGRAHAGKSSKAAPRSQLPVYTCASYQPKQNGYVEQDPAHGRRPQ